MSGDAASGSDGTLDELRRRLVRTYEMLRGSTVDVRPFRPGEDGPLASFDLPPTHEERDRYWVNAPFAFVVITYDTEESEHRYNVVEPDLDEFEAAMLDRVREDIRDPLLYRDGDVTADETVLTTELKSLLEEYGVEVGMGTFHKLRYYLVRDFRGFGRLDPLMNDPHIEDVSCDGYDLPIFVYHDQYTDIGTNVVFEEAEDLDNYVVRLAQQSGRHISVGDPVLGTTLPDGSRIELALGEEVTPRGSAFTIRQYANDPFTPIDLIEYGTFSIEQMAYLWLAIENNKSLIFAGGTASGKTTSMNAVSMFVPPRSKVLSIEDTRELSLYHDNWLSSVTRERLHEGADIDMYDLLRSALRHRPEYIIVGAGQRGGDAVPSDEHRSHHVLDDARRQHRDGDQPAGERTDQRPAGDDPVARPALCPAAHPPRRRAGPPFGGDQRDRWRRPANRRTRLLERLHLGRGHRHVRAVR